MDVNQIEQKAMQLQAKGKDGEALKLYTALLRRDPSNRRIRKTIADLHMSQGQHKQAEKRYLEVVEAMVKEGQFRIAIPIYKELIKLRQKDHDMLIEIGDCYIKANFPKNALESYAKAVELTQRLKPEVAQKVQRKIVDLKPGDLSERITLAELLETANWVDKASDEWRNLAETSRRIGKSDDQAIFLERAIGLRDHWELRKEAASARISIGNHKKSLEHLLKIYKSHSNNPDVVELLATGLEGVGQSQKAGKVWLQAANLLEKTENPERWANALRRVIACGFGNDNIESLVSKADRKLYRQNLVLHKQDWASVDGDKEISIVVKASTLYDYKQFEDAIKVLLESGIQTLSLKALLIECKIAMGLREEAIQLIQKFNPPNIPIQDDLNSRLGALGFAVEADDEIDEDLLDDEFMDDSDGASDLSTSTPPEEPDPITELEKQAEALTAQGDFDRAIDVYSKILELNEDHDFALLRIGELMSRTSDQNVEEEPIQEGEFEDIEPDDFTFTMDDDEDLISEETPLPTTDDIKSARSHFWMGEYDKALNILSTENGYDNSLLISMIHYEQHDYASARKILEDAIEDITNSHEHYLDGLWLLAKTYFKLGKNRSTIRCLEELRESPDFVYRKDVQAWLQGLQDS